MYGTPITIKTVSDNTLKRYITRKQAEIIALERVIVIQNAQMDNEMDEHVLDALAKRILFNETLLETSKVKRDNAMKEYKLRMKLRPIMKQSEYLRQSISNPLETIANANSEEGEETEGGKRHVRRRTTVRRIKKLRRTRRGSKRTYK
jgi:hypothetical protein